MKIVNFPRFITAMSIFACIISFVISLMTNVSYSAERKEYKDIVVAKGDTLWSIALTLEGDVKENIYEIKKINNLENSMIYEGQSIKVPAGNYNIN